MCLSTNDPTIKVAEQDIVVYKDLTYPKVSFLYRLFKPSLANPFSSNYLKHIYAKGVEQPKVSLKPVQWNSDIYTVDPGYHSHAEPSISNSKFIIPKGAKYIEGYNNHNKEMKNYVSETIVFVGKL